MRLLKWTTLVEQRHQHLRNYLMIGHFHMIVLVVVWLVRWHQLMVQPVAHKVVGSSSVGHGFDHLTFWFFDSFVVFDLLVFQWSCLFDFEYFEQYGQNEERMLAVFVLDLISPIDLVHIIQDWSFYMDSNNQFFSTIHFWTCLLSKWSTSLVKHWRKAKIHLPDHRQICEHHFEKVANARGKGRGAWGNVCLPRFGSPNRRILKAKLMKN